MPPIHRRGRRRRPSPLGTALALAVAVAAAQAAACGPRPAPDRPPVVRGTALPPPGLVLSAPQAPAR